MNLLTIADGFGDSNTMPPWYPDFFKWPEIIKFMTKGVELTNLSRYGAGNEYILQRLRYHLVDQQVVLVQWASPRRLDLVLDHCNDFWQKNIAKDPVYANNVVELNNQQWWLSSGTTDLSVKEYHTKFISLAQHESRSQMFVEHATLLLSQKKIYFRFLLTPNSDYLRQSIKDTANWCWHEPFKGMDSFRKVSKFADLDFGITQPISLVQFDFVKTYIMPGLNLPWRNSKEIDAVENMLYRKYQQAKQNKPHDKI